MNENFSQNHQLILSSAFRCCVLLQFLSMKKLEFRNNICLKTVPEDVIYN